ncbi:MAG: DUF3311 domain-containing protein [Planctomycetes bacterium]|nr:DUF3311 domain-containing protein [Planctomycetota bacterium]
MRKLVYGLIILLAVLHQDFWWWHTAEPLVLGFVPIGLAFHAGISVAAAVLWALAVKYCWPADVDALDTVADQPEGGE